MDSSKKKMRRAKKPKKRRARQRRAQNKMAKLDIVSSEWMTAKEKKAEIKVRHNDPRNSAVTSSSAVGNRLTNQLNTVVIQNVLDFDALIGMSQAYVAYANQRGYSSTTSDPSYPYWASCYMTQVLASACSSTTPRAIRMPLWLAAVCNALLTKSAPMKQGIATYSYIVNVAIPSSEGIIVGPLAYGYGSPWTYASTPVVGSNGFPQCIESAVYTEANGVVAWTSLMNFMSTDTSSFMAASNKIVNWADCTECLTDVSAFCPVTTQMGGGVDGISGFGATAQSEVPIFTPFLAQLLQNNPGQPLNNRYPTYLQNVAGDPFFLAGAATAFVPMTEWGSRNPPKFHCIDFNEFLELMALYITRLYQSWGNDATNVPASIDPAFNPVTLQCPLTLEEFSFLLRNTLMSAFRTTQPAVQALYPITPATGNDNQFVAFQAGPNTCSIDDTGVLLPTPVIENVRALIGRRVGAGKGAQHYVPVLGVYNSDVINNNDYQVTLVIGDTPTVLNPFAAPLATNTNADLINGYSSSVGSYLQINDPGRLTTLTSFWNNWVTSWPSVYSVPLGQMGNELGINALCSINLTRHWFNDNDTERMITPVLMKVEAVQRVPPRKVEAEKVGTLEKRKSAKQIRFRDPRSVVPDATPYGQRNSAVVTSQSPFLSVPFTEVQNTWILPVNNASGSTPPTSVAFYTRYQELMNEPFSAITTSGNIGVGLNDLHAQFSALLVHGRDAPPSTWIQCFDEMARLGRGGILSALVDGFLGKGTAKSIASVANQLW